MNAQGFNVVLVPDTDDPCEQDPYDQNVELSYNDTLVYTGSKLTFLYGSWSGDFLEADELLQVNFGKDDFFPHALRRLGNGCVVIPVFKSITAEYYERLPIDLSFIPYVQIEFLWSSLGYDLDVWDRIGKAAREDCIYCWLLNSKIPHYHTTVLDFADLVAYNLLAVDPGEVEDAKSLFSQLFDEQTEFSVVDLSGWRPVTFYMAHGRKTYDWLALSRRGDRVAFNLTKSTGLELVKK